MKVEPFGYLLALERSLSAAPIARYVAAKMAGSRPARYSRWACKPEAQFQCALSRNNGYATASTLPLIMRYRNTLRRRGLRHRIAYIARFRVIPLTQFRIFARKSPFSRSGSHIIASTSQPKQKNVSTLTSLTGKNIPGSLHPLFRGFKGHTLKFVWGGRDW